MIRVKESVKSADRNEAIKFAKDLVRLYLNEGYVRGGDIFVTRKRGTTPGSNCYEANFVMVGEE